MDASLGGAGMSWGDLALSAAAIYLACGLLAFTSGWVRAEYFSDFPTRFTLTAASYQSGKKLPSYLGLRLAALHVLGFMGYLLVLWPSIVKHVFLVNKQKEAGPKTISVTPSMLIIRLTSSDTDYLREQISKLIDFRVEEKVLEAQQYLRGASADEEVWLYMSGADSWENLAGRFGLATVRNGVIVKEELLLMN
jgi:hypothetical protein